MTLKVYLVYMMMVSASVASVIGAEKQPAAKGDFPPADRLPEVKELPDPFLMQNGKRVKTLEDWKKRREEIKEMLLYYQFGSMPPPPGNVTAEITSKSKHRMEVKLTMGPEKKLEMGVRIWFAKGKGPFPVIVRPKHYSGGMPSKSSRRGYMEARYDNCALDPDKRDTVGPAQAAYPDYDWGTIAVWAWGGMRVIDYLMTLEEVDKEKIIVTGHSRGGKTALCIGAFDERVTLTVPNGSGTGGAESYRYLFGRYGPLGRRGAFARIHWFHPRLRKFVKQKWRIPFDQHTVMALVAPRALITVNAMHDKDSDPRSTQITYQATRKVFSWLGAEDKLGIYYRQTGGHKQGPEDWGALLDFADLIFFGKKPENGCKFDVLPFPDEKLRFSWKAPKKDK